MSDIMENHIDSWKRAYGIKNDLVKKVLSEFYATALLRFIGTGGLVSFVIGGNNLLQVNLTWGFAITLSVYSAFYTSGGHVNPAVTVVLCAIGEIPFRDTVCYCLAQTAGAAVGAALAFIVYYDAINNFDGGVRSAVGQNTSTGMIFASFPAPYLSNVGAFVDQLAGTGLLGVFIAFAREHRDRFPIQLFPLLFGVIATMISVCYSMNMTAPVNPASDLGSRIMAAILGYGKEMFTYHHAFFYIPVIAPILGAFIGAYSYILFISIHIPKIDTLPK